MFQRDDYQCRVCGDADGGNLNAHHIRPFRSHRALRDVISNGITLCERCHDEVHYIEEEFAPWFERLVATGPDHTDRHVAFEAELERVWAEHSLVLRRMYWEEELSTTAIGKSLGVDPKTVTYRMEKLGIPRRSRAEGIRVKHRDTVPDDFATAYQSGKPLKSLAKQFGVSLGTLHSWRNKLGLPRRKRHRLSGTADLGTVPRARLESLYVVEGLSQTEIAKMYGTTNSAVSKRLDQFGISLSNAEMRRRQAAAHALEVPDTFAETYADRSIPVREVARRYAVSVATVHNWRNRLGLPKRGHKG